MPVSLFRRLVFGNPLRTERAAHERLPILLALPIFASDALSSVAYATEAILTQLQELHVSPALYYVALPISIAIISLILMVVVSYWQVIFSYPSGGGSYTVARENLGLTMGLIAASSLLVDYILTVAVSVSDGVGQGTSALKHVGGVWGALSEHKTALAVVIVLLIMLANIRGVRESGALFAGPSYGFIVVVFMMLAAGFYHVFAGHTAPHAMAVAEGATKPLNLWFIMRGFASGCAALTGIEAVSNGVQAFKKPEARNASLTLGILGVILAVMFIGITYLAVHFNAAASEHETVISQISRASFGTKMPWGVMYYAVQALTVGILVLAANTAFSGFPRLSAILAQDGFLPRQLATLGDRLAYNNGIIVLSVLALGFILAFHAESQALLPLYTVGVFIAFTSAQFGMVHRFWHMSPKPLTKMAINFVGGTTTLIVLGVVASGKFWVERPLFGLSWLHEGAWMSMLLMGIIYWQFRGIHAHYQHVDSQLAHIPPDALKPVKHTVIVLCPSRIHRGILAAVNYALSMSPDSLALHIAFDPEREEKLRRDWEAHVGDKMPLVIINSPYRTLVEPLMDYLDAAGKVRSDDVVTVVLPEFVPARWWHNFLHNAHGWILRVRLFYRKDIVIVSVRYYLDR